MTTPPPLPLLPSDYLRMDPPGWCKKCQSRTVARGRIAVCSDCEAWRLWQAVAALKRAIDAVGWSGG